MQKDQHLRRVTQLGLLPDLNIERAGLRIQVNEGDQCQQ